MKRKHRSLGNNTLGDGGSSLLTLSLVCMLSQLLIAEFFFSFLLVSGKSRKEQKKNH